MFSFYEQVFLGTKFHSNHLGKGNWQCLMGDLPLVSPVLLKQYADWVGLWEPGISHSEWCCENKSLLGWEYLHRTADVGSPCHAHTVGLQVPWWEGVKCGSRWDVCMLGFGDISLGVSDSSEPFADLLKDS